MESDYRRGSGAMPVRVLIADDHRVVRRGLSLVLALDPEIEVVGEAGDGVEAVERARELRPDVVVMDVVMPGMDGIAATAAIRRELPATQVIALTSALGDHIAVDAVRAGALSYLLKDAAPEEVCQAVRAAAAGTVMLAPAAAAQLVRELAPRQQANSSEALQQLTEREHATLRLLGAGKSNREIAAEFGIGEATVKTHVRNVLTKLGLRSRTQAALYAAQHGLAERTTAPPDGSE
jgi:NarL family two-component system response regulator LiaR